jgi:hypothetical protein
VILEVVRNQDVLDERTEAIDAVEEVLMIDRIAVGQVPQRRQARSPACVR